MFHSDPRMRRMPDYVFALFGFFDFYDFFMILWIDCRGSVIFFKQGGLRRVQLHNVTRLFSLTSIFNNN